MLRNKNVTSTSLMNPTQSIPSPLPLVENRTFKLSPRVEFYAKKEIMVLHKNIKREFSYQTFIETIAGNHIECELKAVMDLSITACLRLRRRKTPRLSPVSRYFVSINNG